MLVDMIDVVDVVDIIAFALILLLGLCLALASRIHASIRRQLKDGAMDPNGIAFEALKDVLLLLETH